MEEDIELQSVDEIINDIERCGYIDAHLGRYDDYQIDSILHYLKQYKQLEEENKTLNERNQYLVKYRAKLEKELYESNENYIPVSLVKEKIEELDKRIDFLNTELTKCYIEREKLGTETDIDNNETYIFYMEEEKNFREKQEEVLQELLREE